MKCKKCGRELIQESLETGCEDEWGRELYQIVHVCPRGCDGYYAKYLRPPVPFKWRGIHHGYLGGWFVAFGAFFLYMNWGNGLDFLNPFYGLFVVVGAVCIVDDVIEHTITADTPLRRLWEWIIYG